MTLAPEIDRFVLGVYCPRAHDGTSLYRAMGPFTAMERQDRRLELRPARVGPEGLELAWNWLLGCDALFIQRPWLDLHAQLIVQAKTLGLPVWVDWDDDYPSIHPSNPTFEKFVGCKERLDQITQLADVVTVTTDELVFRRKLNVQKQAQFWVIPNAAQFPMQKLEQPRARRICWRGGTSHTEDLLQFLPMMVKLANAPAFKEWDWIFLGDVPWQVTHAMPRERLISDFGAEPWLYMEAMGKLFPWVHIVPLAKIPFNPPKSNIAWIEATLAGAVTLGPDWPEWHRPGLANYASKEDFGHVLGQIIATYDKKANCHPNVLASRQYVSTHLTLRKINEQRWAVLNRLVELNEERFFSKAI